MVECELCGSRATARTEIDGAVLDVCQKCAKSGKQLNTVRVIPTRKPETKIAELDYAVKEDFSKVIKQRRQEKNLTQNQLAKILGIKSSEIRRIEEGWEPSLSVIRKLERFFGVHLIETIPETVTKRTNKKEMTIGDLAEIA